MGPIYIRAGWIAGVFLAVFPSFGRAEASPDPLRLISAKADLLITVEHPRRLVEGVMALDAFKHFQHLDAVHELYESTNYRRFFQLLGYFEKELQAGRLDLLDRLAGGGIVFAAKFKPEPTVVLVVQGQDAKTLVRAFQLATQVAEQEMARLESKDRLVRGSHRNVPTMRVGKDFAMAVVGSALVLSNGAKGLHSAIDLHLDGPAKSMVHAAPMEETRKLLPASPDAFLWLNLKYAHEEPGFKGLFDQTKDNGLVALFFGGFFNITARSPYLCIGLYQKAGEFDWTLRYPCGREGLPEAIALHLPEDSQASLPLLEPPHTAFTASYYVDLAKLWSRRTKLLKPQELKGLDMLEKNSGLFLGGVKLSKLLAQLGPHQRLVIADQSRTEYKNKPNVRFPAAALVLEMRDPDFARTAETMVRAAGLLASFKFNMKLVEETHGKNKIIGYRFPEAKLPGDEGNLRFNVSPCVTKVGNQFVLSSTLELARDLVDALEKEPTTPSYSASTLRARGFATGLAAALKSSEEQLLTQAILAQALTPAVAREQVGLLIKAVQQLGTVQMQTHYSPKEFHVDFQWRLAKTN